MYGGQLIEDMQKQYIPRIVFLLQTSISLAYLISLSVCSGCWLSLTLLLS